VRLALSAATLALVASAAKAEPVPRVPAYIHPTTVADAHGAMAGESPTARDGGVWYPADTHHRLVVTLAAVRPMSDARATQAWAWGYADGRLATHGECEAERARRVEAEAKVETHAAGLSGYVAASAVGLVAGLVAGVVLGGLL
jgi:hypothetical protein